MSPLLLPHVWRAEILGLGRLAPGPMAGSQGWHSPVCDRCVTYWSTGKSRIPRFFPGDWAEGCFCFSTVAHVKALGRLTRTSAGSRIQATTWALGTRLPGRGGCTGGGWPGSPAPAAQPALCSPCSLHPSTSLGHESLSHRARTL